MNKQLTISRFFIAGLFFSSFIFSPFVLDFTLTTRLVALSLFILIAIYFLYKSGSLLEIKIDLILFAYSSYLLVCLLSMLLANTKSEALFENCKLCCGFAVFLLTVYSLNNKSQLLKSFLEKFPVIIFFIGLTAALWQVSALQDFQKESIYSVTGINGHKNLYASFLFLNLFFLIKGCFSNTKKIWKILTAFSIVLSLLMIVFIRTKAVWIGISISAMCGMLFYFKAGIKLPKLNFKWLVALITLITNIFFLCCFQPGIEKIIKTNESIIELKPEQREKIELDNERLVLWNKTISVWEKHPLLGVGMGNWQINFPDETLTGLWRAEDLNYTFQRPHNDFLWILSETGIIGFNLYLLFLVSFLLLILQAIKKNTSFIINRELILCFCFIIGYSVISFFDFPKERVEHIIWINIIFGIAYYNIKQMISLPSFTHLKIGKPFYGAAFLCFLFITGISILRCKGEYYTRKMYDDKKTNNYIGVIKHANQAQSIAYRIDPTSLPLAWFIGNAYAASSNYKLSSEYLLEAYQLNPYNRNVINDLASAYAFNNNTEMAKKLYAECSRISPRFDEPKLNLTALYLREQNYLMADSCLHTLYHDSERRTGYQKMTDAFLQKKP